MDFLSNLTSLALGEIPAIKPLLPVLTSQSNNANKYFDEVDRERSNPFGRNDPLEENQIQQEINFNSPANEQKELKDYEKVIPVKGKRIFSFDKNLTKSIEPAEQSIQSDSVSFVEENGVIPSETKAVTSKNYVSQKINELFEGDETVLKLKNTGNKTEKKVEIQFVNPQSKSPKNILDNKNNNTGFITDGSNAAKASTIKINIRRIEVRAIYPEQVISSKTEKNKPQLSLNEYLRSFNEGKR